MEETERLVQGEINKIFPAFCIFLFRSFKNSNIDSKEKVREFAKHIQDSWKKENNNSTCNKHLPYNLTQSLDKQETVTDPQVNPSNSFHKLLSEDLRPGNTQKQLQHKSKNSIKPSKQITQEIPFESNRPNLNDNLRSIENILTVNDEIERRTPYLPTILHEALFDKAEHLSQIHSKLGDHSNKKELSEDSGVYSEDFPDDESVNLKTLPFLNVDIPTKNQSVAVASIVSILNDIKTETDSNTSKVFYDWKDSVVEHSCSLVARCALKGVEFEELVTHFTIDLLQDIWTCVQMNQHIIWSQKIDILKEFISTPAICLEILYFIAGVLENVTTATRKGFCTSLLLVKVAIFLDLIPFMVRRFNVLLNTSTSQSSKKVVNVAKLWQEKLSSVLIEEEPQNMEEVIKTEIIPKLTIFLTCTAKKQPLIYLKAKEALEDLENISSEFQLSQDSLSNIY